MMKACWTLCIALLMTACTTETVPETATARLNLARAADGFIDVEIHGAAVNPRALQAELLIDSAAAYVIADVTAPAGVRLDTVRAEMRGANRAILFAGDKRGVRLSRDGAVARFRIDPVGDAADARISLGKVLVVAADGTAIAVEPGPAVPLR